MAEERELQVEFKAQPGIIESGFFPRLEAWIGMVSAPYRDAVVTEDNLKQSEEDLAKCRKTYNTLETERKNLKKTWNAPYEEWEKRYKAAVSVLTETIDNIDTQVKVFKAAEKNARTIEVSEAICQDIRDIAGKRYEAYFHLKPLWSRVFKEEYANKTYSRNKAQLEWRQAISQIASDFQAIGEDHDLLIAYSDTGSLAEATMKVKEFRKREEMLNADVDADGPVEDKGAPVLVAEEVSIDVPDGDDSVSYCIDIPSEDKVPEEEKAIAALTRRYTGPKYKLRILLDFAERLGLTAEKVTK